MISNIISVSLVVVTLYVAILQYRSSHAPVLNVARIHYKLTKKIPNTEGTYDSTFYEVNVKNSGNGICLDSFLIIKEIRKKRKIEGKKINNNYHISKPTRTIYPNEERKLSIYQTELNQNIKEVKFMVVYMDFLGRKYLASDVMNGELRKGQLSANEHFEKFAIEAKLLSFWSRKKWIYKRWMKKAVKQRNTESGRLEKDRYYNFKG